VHGVIRERREDPGFVDIIHFRLVCGLSDIYFHTAILSAQKV